MIGKRCLTVMPHAESDPKISKRTFTLPALLRSAEGASSRFGIYDGTLPERNCGKDTTRSFFRLKKHQPGVRPFGAPPEFRSSAFQLSRDARYAGRY